VVHGGKRYHVPVVINETVMAHLVELSPICPLHQPPALSVVNALQAIDKKLVHIAAFDTAFHYHRPEIWSSYALPKSLRDQGVRCYGFHGLSYQAIMRKLETYLPNIAKKRLIIAHLGSGCSITAVDNGKSKDSTFGFSGLDGVPMGTRPGHLDSGVILYMVEQGRTHQIRVHMTHAGYPLVGDPLYAGRFRIPPAASPTLVQTLKEFPRQALHARFLELEHPATGQRMKWTSPLPEDLVWLLSLLRQDNESFV
jgi:hypothetical protein